MTGYISDWKSLSEAIEYVAGVVEEAKAWPQIKQAIRDGKLPARGRLTRGLSDSVDGDISGIWFTALAWDDPELGRDILWFDNEERHKLSPPAPAYAEHIEVDGSKLEKLWPQQGDAKNDGAYSNEVEIYFKKGLRQRWEKQRPTTKAKWTKAVEWAIRLGHDGKRTQEQMASAIANKMGLREADGSPKWQAVQRPLNTYFIDWANPHRKSNKVD